MFRRASENEPKRPLKIFLSTGTTRDNMAANRRFRRILEEKGYELKFVQTNESHNWQNWQPLVDDVFIYFYGTDAR